ncbi:MAG TPA: toll/interleukin-1 receptor domain-containing protein [Thermoanaerobaculia bacterium]|nr:toll/interleukin-1 receptor domain-containing protein [Thermoanaerobaculia bacterium]
MKIFFSHGNQDKPLIHALRQHFSHLETWVDEHELIAGEPLSQGIKAAIDDGTSCLVIFLSRDSVKSPWVKAELQWALEKEKHRGQGYIVPVVIEPLDEQAIPGELGSRVYLKYNDRSQAGIHAFARQLEDHLIRLLLKRLDSPAAMHPGSEPAPDRLPRLHLPHRPDFIGRAQELDSVIASFKHPRSWLTAIEGIAGIGKTSLAIQAAYVAVEDGIFDAAVFNTAKDSDLSLQDVMVSILRTLQDNANLEEYDQVQLTHRLLKTWKTLVIIDNFNTIERDRSSISSFLSDLPPPSKALIASRRLEKLEATHVAVGQMREGDALRLLRSEWSRYYPGQKKRPKLRIIWERTGGNPLFMKLAMARFKKGLSLDRILDALDRAKGETFSFYEDLWDEMSDDARLVLCGLAIFAAPARWDSLLATTGLTEERLEAAIEALVEMILVEASEETADTMRGYQLHPLTKKFAESKLQENPSLQNEMRRQFVIHFLGITRQHGGRAWDNYGALDREQKNIFGAMDLLATMEDWKDLVDITMQVRHFVLRQDRFSLVPPNRLSGYLAQAKYVCEKGLAAAVKANSRKDECRFLLELGNIEIIRGKLEAARSHLVHCIELCKEIDDPKRGIMALRRLAHIEVRQNRREAARELYQESLSAAETLADAIGIARCLRSLGDLAFEEGKFEEAADLYGRSLERADADLDPVGMPRAARRIGNVLHRKGELDKAAKQFQWVVTLYLRKHDLSGACYSLYALGRVQEDRGVLPDAVRCWLGSLRALGFVHREFWPAVLKKLENLVPASAAAAHLALETYVPPVDGIISLCFDSIARIGGRLGPDALATEKESIVREWVGWEGEWVTLINDVVEKCHVE